MAVDFERLQTCFVDFVGLTLRVVARGDDSAYQLAGDIAKTLIQRWFPGASVTDTGRGCFGYSTRLDIEGVGIAAYGGNGDTLFVQLTGDGCRRVRDWASFADDLESMDAKLTRVDLAYDDLYGKDWSLSRVRQLYAESGFKPSRGLSPSAQLWSDEGSGKGSTYYVGSRSSGKLFRGYEKGKEQGDPLSPWFRLEVEWHATHRDLSIDMLRDPTAYLSGAYPCLSELCDEQETVKTWMFSAAASVEKAVDHAKKQAGRTLRFLAELSRKKAGSEHLDDSHILAAARAILRPDMPSRLLSHLTRIESAQEAEQGRAAPFWWQSPTDLDRDRLQRLLSADVSFWRKRDQQATRTLSGSFSMQCA